ncbi:MAG: hypothetical protein Q7K48_06015 [Fusobacterium sp. JB021]|nr:hypothetical protein [Fusobacterium sp. JB021]MDP0506505.1 hypothetical protein [Fusobacterium sp. JB019]MDP0506538.1 hypothetical protein [Fusobacterium sp. JB019]
MLKIFNVNVYGLEESAKASGYPMISGEIPCYDDIDELSEKEIKRIKHLGNAIPGSGHDCFLKGITVQFDITYPNYWTPQFQRYHFADIVSSTSKMHRITRMDLNKTCNKYVDDVVIENLQKWVDIYNSFPEDKNEITIKENTYDKYKVFMKIISNAPLGLEQTMRVTTNYLQLKSIYNQRRHHKLKEDWGAFCDWCLTLPMFKDLCIKNK